MFYFGACAFFGDTNWKIQWKVLLQSHFLSCSEFSFAISQSQFIPLHKDQLFSVLVLAAMQWKGGVAVTANVIWMKLQKGISKCFLSEEEIV